MKRMSLALAFVALLSVEFGCVVSGAIASTPREIDSKTSLTPQHTTQQTTKEAYTPPPVGMPTRTEGGGTR